MSLLDNFKPPCLALRRNAKPHQKSSRYRRIFLISFCLCIAFGAWWLLASHKGKSLFLGNEPAGLTRSQRVLGIDVSKHQGKINWRKVAKHRYNGEPIGFAIVKATEGVTKVDKRFDENFQALQRNHIVRGAYHFYLPHKSAQLQALRYISKVRLSKGDLAPILDVEPTDHPNVKDLQESVLTWLNIVESHYGVTPIIYTSPSIKATYLDSPKFDRFRWWVAHYNTSQPRHKGHWDFWQFTELGKVDGIKGNYVDLNYFNGNLERLQTLTL